MQAASMPVENRPPHTDARPGPNVLKVFLIVIAAVQTQSALFHLTMLAASTMDTDPVNLGWVAKTVIAIGPVVAIAALVYAAKNRLHHAIMAVAAMGVLDWINYMPSFTKHGLDFSVSAGSLMTLLYFVALPACSIAALVMAARNVRLGWAAVLAAMPILLVTLGALVFGAAVAIYGF